MCTTILHVWSGCATSDRKCLYKSTLIRNSDIRQEQFDPRIAPCRAVKAGNPCPDKSDKVKKSQCIGMVGKCDFHQTGGKGDGPERYIVRDDGLVEQTEESAKFGPVKEVVEKERGKEESRGDAGVGGCRSVRVGSWLTNVDS